MTSIFENPALLVHIAASFQVLAFLVRDQLVLRALMMIGTVCYLAYYYFAVSPPLWAAFSWSGVMGAANLSMMILLGLERTTFNLSDDNKRLYKIFHSMTPGEFRRLMKVSSWQTGDVKKELTREGEPVENLYYIFEGQATVEKQGEQFTCAPGSFIGEVAFFLGSVASATVRVEPDTRYVQWNITQLRGLQDKNPGIRAALHSILNDDMALKVARSMGGAAIA